MEDLGLTPFAFRATLREAEDLIERIEDLLKALKASEGDPARSLRICSEISRKVSQLQRLAVNDQAVDEQFRAILNNYRTLTAQDQFKEVEQLTADWSLPAFLQKFPLKKVVYFTLVIILACVVVLWWLLRPSSNRLLVEQLPGFVGAEWDASGSDIISLTAVTTSVAECNTISNFSGLLRLDLSRSSQVEVRPMSTLSNLQELVLSYTDIDSSDITQLTNLPALKTLHVDHTSVNDAAIVPLLSLQSLEKVVAVNSQVTTNSVPIFQKHAKRLILN
jgi:hypothetical protein